MLALQWEWEDAKVAGNGMRLMKEKNNNYDRLRMANDDNCLCSGEFNSKPEVKKKMIGWRNFGWYYLQYS